MKSVTLILLLVIAMQVTALGQTTAPWDPPLITLHETGISPQEAFDKLGAIGGVAFQTAHTSSDNNRPGSIDIDIKEQPFWLAVKEICDASHVEIGSDSRPMIMLNDNSAPLWNNGIVVSSGPVVFVLTSVQRTTRADLRQPTAVTRTAIMSFMTYIDPRVRAAQAAEPFVVTEATDDKGQKLKQINRGSNGTFQNPWSLYQTMMLEMPEKAGIKITKLAGDAHFLVDEQTESIEAKLPLTKPISRNVGGFPLVLSEAKKNGSNFNVKISYNRKGGDKAAYAKMRAAFDDWTHRIEVLDESNQPLGRGGWSGSSSEDERSVELYFNPSEQNAEAVKIVWPMPIKVKDLAIPFEFTDLPLEDAKPAASGEKANG